MAELEAEARLLVGETELLCGRPDARDLIRRHPGTYELDCGVQPLPALLVSVDLRVSHTADVECPVVTGPVAHERMDDVEERLISGTQEPVGEHMRMREIRRSSTSS